MIKKLRKKILFSLALAALCYLGFTIYADYNEVAKAFTKFNWLLLPVLLALSFLNYVTRFMKWHYYLILLKVKLKVLDSFSIFMSSLIMSITPGKMGELLKAYLVKQVVNEPVSKTAPVIFAERITDFLSLVMFAVAGAYVFDYGRAITIIVGVFFVALVIILSNKKIAIPIINLFEKISFLKKHLSSIHNAYESSYIMLRPKPLIYMVLLSLVSWFFECFGYYLILQNFNVNNLSIFWASFVYAFATIVGAISMLPGGLGLTEGSLTYLIVKNGDSNEVAVASTFIVRAVTLWFAVLVGIIAVTFYQKRFGEITETEIN